MMRQHRSAAALAVGALLVGLAGRAAVATAQPNSYTLTRGVVAGGGGISTSTSYTLTGTVGQPVVGVMTGSTTTLGSGFWAGGGGVGSRTIYLPFVSRH